MFCPYNWVMVKQEKLEELSEGGIIIPDKVRDKNAPLRGNVVCAGVECKYVKVDDQVMFDKKGSFTDKIPRQEGGDDEYAFMKETDVLAVLNRDLQ